MNTFLATLIRFRRDFSRVVDDLILGADQDRRLVERERMRILFRKRKAEYDRIRRERIRAEQEEREDWEERDESEERVDPPKVDPPNVDPHSPTVLPFTGPVHPAVVAGEVPLETVGEEKHAALIETWLRNWKVDTAPQPDRTNALLSTYTGWLRPWKAYLRWKGGLASGTRDALLKGHHCLPEDADALAKAVASEIAAVGSTLSLPVDGFLEASLFTDPNGPLRGGMVADVAKMDRPGYAPPFSG